MGFLDPRLAECKSAARENLDRAAPRAYRAASSQRGHELGGVIIMDYREAEWVDVGFWKKWGLLLLGLLGTALFLPLAVQAHISSGFHVKGSMDAAGIVCKVRVLSVSRPWIPHSGGHQTAKVKCLSAIKGTPPEKFEIVYPAPTSMDSYTDLEQGETCIVFLQSTTPDTAHFADVDNGKMPCVETVVPYTLGTEAKDRMLCEVLALGKSATAKNKLLAAEYLGQLADARGKAALAELSLSAEPILRCVALAARIECGDAPSPETLLAALTNKADTARLDILPPTYHIMSALERSIVQERLSSRQRPIAVLANFDYVRFYNMVWESRMLAADEGAQADMGRALRKLADPASVPLLQKMLDAPTRELRYFAVTSLMRIYHVEHMPSVGLFAQKEAEYLAYWKNRLK